MKLLSLLIGLAVERLATQLFHLRQLGWLESLIDAGLTKLRRASAYPALLAVVVLVLLFTLPVTLALFAVTTVPSETDIFAYMFLAIIVLFFSFGPKDIGEEVDEYCTALEEDDPEKIREAAAAIIDGEVPEDARERMHRVEAAVCIQANNRLFAIIFWFILLGPLGAWVYRVSDLLRRRAQRALGQDESEAEDAERVYAAAANLHGWLAWLPARLTAIGYAGAGHFDAALSAWRALTVADEESVSLRNEHLLAQVGVGALALGEEAEDLTERGVRGATAANRLVFRLLLAWAFIIALMTLSGLGLTQ